jgi:hypothetical protein
MDVSSSAFDAFQRSHIAVRFCRASLPQIRHCGRSIFKILTHRGLFPMACNRGTGLVDDAVRIFPLALDLRVFYKVRMRAHADGADALQPAVPQVCRDGD